MATYTDKDLSHFIINKMTAAQYSAATKDPDQLYIITDQDPYIPDIPSLTAQTDVADGDYFPYYDISTSSHKKTLWSNIKSVLKTYFDTLYNKVVESDVSDWGFTKNTGTVTSVGVKKNGTIVSTVTSSGSIDIGNVVNSIQINGSTAKSGSVNLGTVVGNITLNGSSVTVSNGTASLGTVLTGNHASTATTYGTGTTSNYGHVKLVSGDMDGKTYADGNAAAAAHTHSNYITSQGIYANTPGSGTATADNGYALSSVSLNNDHVLSKSTQVKIPTKTSDLNNDSGFITSHQSLAFLTGSISQASSITLPFEYQHSYHFLQVNTLTNIALSVPASPVPGYVHYLFIFNAGDRELVLTFPVNEFAPDATLSIAPETCREVSYYYYDGSVGTIFTWSDELNTYTAQ